MDSQTTPTMSVNIEVPLLAEILCELRGIKTRLSNLEHNVSTILAAMHGHPQSPYSFKDARGQNEPAGTKDHTNSSPLVSPHSPNASAPALPTPTLHIESVSTRQGSSLSQPSSKLSKRLFSPENTNLMGRKRARSAKEFLIRDSKAQIAEYKRRELATTQEKEEAEDDSDGKCKDVPKNVPQS